MTFNFENGKEYREDTGGFCLKEPKLSSKNLSEISKASPRFLYESGYSFKGKGVEMEIITDSKCEGDESARQCSTCLENKIIENPKFTLKSKKFWILLSTIS